MFGKFLEFIGLKTKRRPSEVREKLEEPLIPYKIRESDLLEQLEKKTNENVKLAAENIRMKKVLSNIRRDHIAKEQQQDIVKASTQMAESQKKAEKKRVIPLAMLDGKVVEDLIGNPLGYAYFAKKESSLVLLVSDTTKKPWKKGMIPLLEGRDLTDILWQSSYITPKTRTLHAKYIFGVGPIPIPDSILIRKVRATVRSENDITNIVASYGNVTNVRKVKKDKKEYYFITAEFLKRNYLDFENRMDINNPAIGKIVNKREIPLSKNVMEVFADNDRYIKELEDENVKMGMAWDDVTRENITLRGDRAILKAGADGIKADYYDRQKMFENILPESMKLRAENLDLASASLMYKTLAEVRKTVGKEQQKVLDELATVAGADQLEVVEMFIARLSKFVIENKEGIDILLKYMKGKEPGKLEKLLEAMRVEKALKEATK